LIIGGIFGAATAIRLLVVGKVKQWSFEERKFEVQTAKKRMFGLFTFFVVAFYTFLIQTSLQPFNCIKQLNGKYTLTKSPSDFCYSNTWNQNFPFVILFLILYGIIFPMVLVVYFLKYRYDLENFDFQMKFGPLIMPYKKLYFFWELVVMIRRAVFIVSSDFLSSSGSYGLRYSSGIALMLFFVWSDALIQPYLTRQFNMFAVAWGLVSCVVLLCQGLVFEEDEVTDAIKYSFGILVVSILGGCLLFAIIHGTRRALKKSAPIVVTKKCCEMMTREAVAELFYANSIECALREGKIEVSRHGFEKSLDFLQKKEILDILSAVGKVGDKAFHELAERARHVTQFQQNALGHGQIQTNVGGKSTIDYVEEVQRKASVAELVPPMRRATDAHTSIARTSSPSQSSPRTALRVHSFNDSDATGGGEAETVQDPKPKQNLPGLTFDF
jgi:hypothetical protein